MDKSYIAGISCPCPMQVWLLSLTEKEPSPLWVEIKNKSTNVNLFNVNTFWISVSYGTHWHQNLRHKFMNLHKILCEMQRWGIMEMLGDLPLEKKDFHIKVYDVFWFDAWFACSVCQQIMHLEVVVVLHLNILQIKDSFHILLSLWFIQKSFIVWLGNDFTPNRAQAITWANNDWIQWSWNVSDIWQMEKMPDKILWFYIEMYK